MEVIRCKLNFENMFVIDSMGKSGGMALFWGRRGVGESPKFQPLSYRRFGVNAGLGERVVVHWVLRTPGTSKNI